MAANIIRNLNICAIIVHFLTRKDDILSLIYTAEPFKSLAEKRLYESLGFNDPRKIALACRTLVGSRHLALLVRSFMYSPDLRRFAAPLSVGAGAAGTADASTASKHGTIALPESFYITLQRALENMERLESLFFNDAPTFGNSWVLSSERFKFRLREVRLKVVWDENTLMFLKRQRRTLALLQLAESGKEPAIHDGDGGEGGVVSTSDEGRREKSHPFGQDSDVIFPQLQVFEGSCTHATQLISLHTPFTHLHFFLDPESPEKSIQDFSKQLARSKASKYLRSLGIIDLLSSNGRDRDWDHDYGALYTLMPTLTKWCPNIRHLGTLQYPIIQRLQTILQYLHALPHLASLELDLSSWTPQPTVPAQRSLCAEIRTFCPSIRLVAIYLSNGCRVCWNCYISPPSATRPTPNDKNSPSTPTPNSDSDSARVSGSGRSGGAAHSHSAGGRGTNVSRGIGPGPGYSAAAAAATASVHRHCVWQHRVDQNSYPQQSNLWKMIS
ncbi:hypothetical protein AX16_006114 [Volvariella volvacea WC 439]|nr:hypothetical protein AX16_006114 [Volvariella volvacea WC 439]